MSERQFIKILAPSTASATCLLADLAPFARVRSISHLTDGYELLLAAPIDGLSQIRATVSAWLSDCGLPSAVLKTTGRTYTVTPEHRAAKSSPVRA